MQGIVVAIVLFLFAAVFGLVVLTAILKDRPTPKPIVFIHGGLALIALLILITYVAVGHTEPLIVSSVILFVLAAVGGLTLFIFDISGKTIPKTIAIIHPIVAIAGVVTLIIYLLT